MEYIYVGIVFIVILFAIVMYSLTTKTDKEKIEEKKQFDDGKLLYKKTKKNYIQSLNALKLNPIDSNLKAQTLKLGREFANLTREFEGVTIYDEMALMNDINAACAGATVANSQTVEERLGKLSELKEKNLISEQEYSERRQKILDEI